MDKIKEKIEQYRPAAALLLVLIAAIYYLSTRGNNGNLAASGTIEAAEVNLASEVGGLVEDVLAKEGDQVSEDAVLVRFDGAFLKARLKQAQASLALAQANYEQIAAQVELQVTAAEQDLAGLYDNEDVARAKASQAVADARDALRDAQIRLSNLNTINNPEDVEEAYARVVVAEDALVKARNYYKNFEDKAETNVKRAQAYTMLVQAQDAYDGAVRVWNYMKGGANEIDFAQAESDVAYFTALLEKLQADRQALDAGPDPDLLALAEANLRAAEAGLPAAEAQVAAAQAAVDLLQVQVEKLEVIAPMAGTVLFRSIEPGEIAQPGAPLITLAQLSNLTVTVYLQEDRYGAISLGDQAVVTVDSFPGMKFTAVVIQIADQAEFTPRNVQTVDGRKTTVFAIKLSIQDPQGKLKPGMPADVLFSE